MSSEEALAFSWLPPGFWFLLVLAVFVAAGLLSRGILLRRFGPDRLDRWNRWVEGSLFILLLAAMILLSGLQVVLRIFFDKGFVDLSLIVKYLVLWMAFLGALAATGRARHIRIDVLGRLLPRNAGRVLTRILSVVGAVICAILTNAAYVYLREEALHGVSPFLGISSWVAQSIILWGFGCMTYRFLVQAIWPTDAQESV